MRRSFPHLGFDPTPGDVAETRSLARQIGNLATELNHAVVDIWGIDWMGWKGKAAIAFRDHIDHDLRSLINKADQSFNNATSALAGWANQLESFQAEAEALEREAATKQATLDSANQALKAAGGPPLQSTVTAPRFSGLAPSPSPSGTDHAQQQKQHAVTDASSALDSVRKRAHELHDRYMRAAGAVGRSLEKAGHIAPAKPGFFHDLVHGVEKSWDATCDWVKKHADLIKAIADVLSDISAVLQVLAIVCMPLEPLGGILELLSLGTGALALTGDLVAKAGGANVSWVDIGMSALGVIPGLGTFAKGSAEVARGVEAGERATQLGELFKTSSIGGHAEMGKALITDAKNEDLVENSGVKLKGVVLFGTKETQTLTATGMRGRLAVLTEDSIAGGQDMGTHGFQLGMKAFSKTVVENAAVRKIVGHIGENQSVLKGLDNFTEWGKSFDTASHGARLVDSSIGAWQAHSQIQGHIPEFRQEFGSRFASVAGVV